MQTVEQAVIRIQRAAEQIGAAQDFILWLWGEFRGPCLPPEVFIVRMSAEAIP